MLIVTKLDIMNARKNETWGMVGGKVQRIESEKVVGPVVENAIKEIEEVEKVELKIKEKKKSKKKSKKK